MEGLLNFLADNYIWFAGISVFFAFALIGLLGAFIISFTLWKTGFFFIGLLVTILSSSVIAIVILLLIISELLLFLIVSFYNCFLVKRPLQ